MRFPRRISVPRRFAIAAAATGLMLLPLLPLSASADQVGDKRAQAQKISQKLAELDSRQMDLNAQYERANYELSQATVKVADAQRTADETSAELDQRQADLARFAVEAYQIGNDSPELAAMFTSDGNLAPQKKGYLQATSGNRQDLIDSLNAARQKAADDAASLEDAKAEAQSHADEITQARTGAQTARDQQQALNSQAQGELATLVAEENATRKQEAAAAAAAKAPPAPTQGATNTTKAPATSPSAPTAPAPAPAPSTPPPAASPPPPPAGSGGGGAIAAALSQIGKPYVWGAAGPDAYDCSGLVLWAYARVGKSLPHYSGAQYAMTTRISASQLQPGDLVFWGGGGSEHVAIYMGGNQLVHAFSRDSGVMVTQLEGWWKPPSGYGRIN